MKKETEPKWHKQRGGGVPKMDATHLDLQFAPTREGEGPVITDDFPASEIRPEWWAGTDPLNRIIAWRPSHIREVAMAADDSTPVKKGA